MTITAQTPWKSIGRVPYDRWLSELVRKKSPIVPEAREAYEAAGDHSALALSQMMLETEAGTTGAGSVVKNSMNIAGPWVNGHTWVKYPTWTAGILDWRHRLLAADGPYAKKTTIYQLISTYAPKDDGNDVDHYVAFVCEYANRYIGGTPVPVDGGYNFGPHPWPNGFDRRILEKGPSGSGWDDLGTRTAGMALTACHHTAGHDDRDAIYNLFTLSGARGNDAATDAVIDRSGKGYLLLDPWSPKPMEGSGMTPWASGPATSLKGIGVQIVQKLGANGVNKCGFSTEHCNVDGQGFTDAQTDLSCKVYAVAISRMKIKYDRWPYNDAIGGIRVDATHDRFAPTSCAGKDWPWGGSYHNAWVEGVRLEAKKLQVGGTSPPTPPEPPPPAPAWPFAFTKEDVARFWGKLRRFGQDGSVTEYPFDEKGSIAAMWLARCAKEGIFPGALEWWQGPPDTHWITFGVPGDVKWVLYLPDITKRADFRWVDRRDLPA
jgi:hypothetical protein